VEDTKCPNGTLRAQHGEAFSFYPARCRRWRCAACGPRKARNLAARMARTPANRLITLTWRTDPNAEAGDILDQMNRAWRSLWKRIKREQGDTAVGYVRVVELTKAGTPHLHIAVKCGYISQAWLSSQWEELTGNSIVDIRAVKTESGMATYLAKYLTKTAAVLQHKRKWSATPGFVPLQVPLETSPDELPPIWSWIPGVHEDHLLNLIEHGYVEISGWLLPPGFLERTGRT